MNLFQYTLIAFALCQIRIGNKKAKCEVVGDQVSRMGRIRQELGSGSCQPAYCFVDSLGRENTIQKGAMVSRRFRTIMIQIT